MDKFNSIADAIDCGAAISEQCSGRLLDEDGRTCALGAAMVGMDLTPVKANLPLLVKRFPQPIGVICPICDCAMLTQSHYKHLALLVHLNDFHNFSREGIASWIREKLSQCKPTTQALKSCPKSSPPNVDENAWVKRQFKPHKNASTWLMPNADPHPDLPEYDFSRGPEVAMSVP